MMESAAKFHEGEIIAQRNANEMEIAARNSRNVSDTIIPNALAFVRQQKVVYVGSIDEAGRVWASVLLGEPGFLVPSADAAAFDVDLSKVAKQNNDPLWENMKHDARLGFLLLELQTRRRLKINGIAHLDGSVLHVQVTESVPVCPRYIQRRVVGLDNPGEQSMPTQMQHGSTLGPEQQELVEQADTFFLASVHESHGADCSHRGGPVGFVKILPNGVLRVPDYNGNSMFNSFGNLLLNPQAGLLLPCYERRRMLQLSGTVTLFWDQADPAGETGGTGRFWEFKVEHWIETELPAALTTQFVDASPFLPKGN